MKAKQWRNQSNNQSNTMECPQNRLCNPNGSRIVFQAVRLFFLTFRECKLTPDAQRRPTVDMKGIPQEFRWFDVIMEAWGPHFDGLIFMGHWGCFTPNKLFIKQWFGQPTCFHGLILTKEFYVTTWKTNRIPPCWPWVAIFHVMVWAWNLDWSTKGFLQNGRIFGNKFVENSRHVTQMTCFWSFEMPSILALK